MSAQGRPTPFLQPTFNERNPMPRSAARRDTKAVALCLDAINAMPIGTEFGTPLVQMRAIQKSGKPISDTPASYAIAFAVEDGLATRVSKMRWRRIKLPVPTPEALPHLDPDERLSRVESLLTEILNRLPAKAVA